MAENTNYIGVAMGLDVTDLKAGLSETNKQIQLANSEFKAASSGMDDWAKSTEGLTAKVTQLETILDLEQRKLAGLRAEYDKVVESQGANSLAAQNLERQINNQQAAVNKTQLSLTNYSTTLQAATDGSINLEQVTLRNGKVVRDYTDRTTEAETAVKNLSSSLDAENAKIQLANSEFQNATAGMDDFTKTTAGVEAKVAQLGTVLTAQNSKLETLSATYAKVAAEQGANSTEAIKLQTQINNQQAVVNATQNELNNYSATLQAARNGTLDLETATLRAGRAIEQTGNELQETGNAAVESGGKMDGLKAVAGGVVAGMAAIGAAAVGLIGGFLSLAESTREFREDTAKLNTAFEAASLSAGSASETYKTLFGAIGESDTAVEAAQQIALLANSEEEAAKWAEIATGVVGTFGDALKPETFYEAANETLKLGEATGAYTQMLEQTGYNVDEFNAGLAECNTEEEKQAYMLGITNQLLGEASENYKENAKDIIAAREAEAALTQATAELGAIAEPIMTTLKLLAAELLQAITPFVELVGKGLTGAFNGAAGSAETLAEGLGGVLNVIVEKITNLLPTVLNIILQLIPSIATTLLNQVPILLDTVLSLVTSIINMLAELLPDIVTKIVDIIPEIINKIVAAFPQLLQAAITFLMAIVQAIPTIITSLLNELPKIIDTIINTVLQALPILIQAAIKLLMSIVEAIPVIVEALTQNLPKIINTIIDGILKALPLLIDAAITLLMAIVNAIPTIIQALVKALPTIINTILQAVTKALPQLLQAAIQLFMSIVNAIPKMLPQLMSMLPQIISTITRVLIQNLPLIIRAGVQLLVGLIKGLVQAIPQLVRMIPQIITSIVRGLASGGKEMLKAGRNIVEGIWNGIKNAGNWIREKISGFAGNVAGWFKKAFKIKSPSKLMEDEVGIYVGEGVVPTSPQALTKIKKQLGQFSNFVTDNLGGIKAGLNLDANVIGGNVKSLNGAREGTVINAGQTIYYNGNLSRKQLKQIENDNYTSIKLKLQAEGLV